MLFGEGGRSGDGFSGAAMPDEQLGHFRRPHFDVRSQQGEGLLDAPHLIEDPRLADCQAGRVRWQRPRVGKGLLVPTDLTRQQDPVRGAPG
jgi:hypothetical protein